MIFSGNPDDASLLLTVLNELTEAKATETNFSLPRQSAAWWFPRFWTGSRDFSRHFNTPFQRLRKVTGRVCKKTHIFKCSV